MTLREFDRCASDRHFDYSPRAARPKSNCGTMNTRFAHYESIIYRNTTLLSVSKTDLLPKKWSIVRHSVLPNASAGIRRVGTLRSRLSHHNATADPQDHLVHVWYAGRDAVASHESMVQTAEVVIGKIPANTIVSCGRPVHTSCECSRALPVLPVATVEQTTLQRSRSRQMGFRIPGRSCSPWQLVIISDTESSAVHSGRITESAPG